jgi:hypothetical protein
MTAVDDWDEDYDPYDAHNYFDDDDDYRDPDPWDYDDYEVAKAWAEYEEHCERKHDGWECDCRTSLRTRLSRRARCWLNDLRYRVRSRRVMRRMRDDELPF